MDKQKQIEEIEKDIEVRMAMAKGVAGSMNNGVEGWLGKYLIEKDWVKIPENAVVLTREEYYYLINDCKRWENLAVEKVDEIITTRKKTAEKLLNKVDYESNGQTKAITDLLRKEYGVETK